MNLVSRLVTGTVLCVGGLGLFLIPLILGAEGVWVFTFYGIPLFIIGLVILFNKNEDRIEEIKLKGGR